MEKLIEYVNGNYTVTIFDDGSKVRVLLNNKFLPAFPESIDLKITNKCDLECKYCHEKSHKKGKHGNLLITKNILKELPEGIEIAIGGGNPLEHPGLCEFLDWCKNEKKFIPNMTINGKHVKMFPNRIFEENLIYGLGISYTGEKENLIKKYYNIEYPNIVSHVIIGVHSLEEMKQALDIYGAILILGYKNFGRGEEFIPKYYDDCVNNLWKLFAEKGILSFDNLSIEQCNIKSFLSNSDWDEFYMGDDGNFTMYYDAVEQKYAKSSTCTERVDSSKMGIIDFFLNIEKTNN